MRAAGLENILVSYMSTTNDGMLPPFGRMLEILRRIFRTRETRAGSIAVSPDVRASFQDDGVVFLQLRSGVVFRSNRVGAAIWKDLGDRREVAEIAARIGSEYGIPEEQAARDTTQFLTQLESQGFLVRQGA